MKFLSVLLSLLLNCTGVLAQSKRIGTFQFTESKSSHTAKLILKTRLFSASAHKVTYADEHYLKKHEISLGARGRRPVIKIDGRIPLGTDGDLPQVEIVSLRFFFNGKEVAVPSRLYSDCYNPNLSKDSARVRFSDGGEGVFVLMNGSDGAGVYDVIWVLRADGRHSRLAREGGDCSFLNLDCGQ